MFAAGAALVQALAPATYAILPPTIPLVEGITSDGRRLWVSSVIDRSLWTVGKKIERRIQVPSGLGAPLGIAFDQRRRWLWVAANCLPELAIPNCGTAHLLAFDLKGRVRAKLRPIGEAAFNPGDVSVTNGQVVVGDSLNGAVYTCTGPCRSLRTLVPAHERGSAQGSAIKPATRELVFADYGPGVSKVDLRTGQRTILRDEEGKLLRGVDGLLFTNGRFVAVQNGAPPSRVLSFKVEGERIIDVRTLMISDPDKEATQVTIHQGRLMVVGNAQWASYLEKQRKPQQGTPLVTLPLPDGR